MSTRYELYLEDGDITLLTDLATGDTIAVPTKEAWNYL